MNQYRRIQVWQPRPWVKYIIYEEQYAVQLLRKLSLELLYDKH